MGLMGSGLTGSGLMGSGLTGSGLMGSVCCQVLDQGPGCVLLHLRGLLLPGVPAERGHVHRGHDADLRSQRETQQQDSAGGGPVLLQRSCFQ